jgi:hypothetical protein
VRPPPTFLLASPTPTPSPSGPGVGVVSPPNAPARWILHAADWAGHRPWLLAVAAALLVTY